MVTALGVPNWTVGAMADTAPVWLHRADGVPNSDGLNPSTRQMMFVFGGRCRIAIGFPNRTGANPETSPVRFVGVVGVPNLVMTPSVGTFQNCRDEGVPN